MALSHVISLPIHSFHPKTGWLHVGLLAHLPLFLAAASCHQYPALMQLPNHLKKRMESYKIMILVPFITNVISSTLQKGLTWFKIIGNQMKTSYFRPGLFATTPLNSIYHGSQSDGSFCLPCVLFGRRIGRNSLKLQRLAFSPFTDWSYACKRFKECEETSEIHKVPLLTMETLISVMKNEVKPVDVVCNQIINERVTRNRQMLSSILTTVILCCRQNMLLDLVFSFSCVANDQETILVSEMTLGEVLENVLDENCYVRLPSALVVHLSMHVQNS